MAHGRFGDRVRGAPPRHRPTFGCVPGQAVAPGGPIPESQVHALGFSDEMWPVIKARHPLGSHVTATVTRIARANRWYTVTFGEAWSRITWTGQPPPVGTTAELVVTKLDTTRRILLKPVGDLPATSPRA